MEKGSTLLAVPIYIRSEVKTIEIMEIENGYIVFDPSRDMRTAHETGKNTWAFETFDSLVDFLKGSISKVHRENLEE